jgi:hypothetical protein
MDPFESDKALLFRQRKVFSEFYDFGRKGKRKTTLDLKYQKLKIARGEKTRAAPT